MLRQIKVAITRVGILVEEENNSDVEWQCIENTGQVLELAREDLRSKMEKLGMLHESRPSSLVLYDSGII